MVLETSLGTNYKAKRIGTLRYLYDISSQSIIQVLYSFIQF
jgi:hypothetical protein